MAPWLGPTRDTKLSAFWNMCFSKPPPTLKIVAPPLPTFFRLWNVIIITQLQYWIPENINNIKLRDTSMFLKSDESWKMKGFYKSNLGSNIQRFYTRIYVSMLDYDLHSPPKNLIRVWEFRRLYDLSTSRKLVFFKQLSLLYCEVLVFI